MTALALDTSVAVPLLVTTHAHHQEVSAWWAGRACALSGHAFAETYSVLTRLPGDLRRTPRDAARLLDERFDAPLLIGAGAARRLHILLSECGIAGGATYDGLVALAAREHDAELATRDARALPTYEAIGARVAVVPTAS